MKLLRVVLVLAGALVVQAGLSRLWPECQRYVGILILPVVWYGAAASPRAAMFSMACNRTGSSMQGGGFGRSLACSI